MNIKQILLLLCIGLSLSCTRSVDTISDASDGSDESSVATTTVLWQNHGGSSSASSTVSGTLPTSITSIGSETINVDYNVYTAPLITKSSDATTTQSVYILAVEDGGTGMKVISYLYDTSDDSFTVQWVNTALNVDASASLQPGYQMSLSVDGSYLYVTHSTGLVMFDASSGSEEDRYSSTQDYYSLLVDSDGAVYALDSAGNLMIFSSDLSSSTSVAISDLSITSMSSHPMVISGSGTSKALYFAANDGTNDNIYKVDLSSNTYAGSALDITTGYILGSMAAIETQSGNSDLIYSETKALYDCAFSNDGANCDDSYSAGNTDFKFYNSSSSEKPTDFLGTIDAQDIDSDSKQIFEGLYSEYTNYDDGTTLLYQVGTGLSVPMAINGEDIYLPGSDVTGGIAVLNNAVTCSLVKVTIGTSAVDASCIISSNVVTIDDSSSSAGATSYSKPVYASIVDVTAATALVVVQHYEAKITDSNNLFTDISTAGVKSPEIRFGNSDGTTDISFTNTDLTISAGAIGDGVAFFVGDDGVLYYTK